MSRFKVLLALLAVIAFGTGSVAQVPADPPSPSAGDLVAASVNTMFDNFIKIIKAGPSFRFHVKGQFGSAQSSTMEIVDFSGAALLQAVTLPLVSSTEPANAFTNFNLDVKADGLYLLGKAKTITTEKDGTYLAIRFGFYKDPAFTQKAPLVFSAKSSDLKIITIHLDSLSGVVRGLEDTRALDIKANASCNAKQELLDLRTLTVTQSQSICLAQFDYTRATGKSNGTYEYSSTTKSGAAGN